MTLLMFSSVGESLRYGSKISLFNKNCIIKVVKILTHLRPLLPQITQFRAIYVQISLKTFSRQTLGCADLVFNLTETAPLLALIPQEGTEVEIYIRKINIYAELDITDAVGWSLWRSFSFHSSYSNLFLNIWPRKTFKKLDKDFFRKNFFRLQYVKNWKSLLPKIHFKIFCLNRNKPPA